MTRRRLLVFAPGGSFQQLFWKDWAFLLGQQGRLDLELEFFGARDVWTQAAVQRESEAGLLGLACTVEDLTESGGEAGDLGALVEAGLPVLAFSRATLQEKPQNLPVLCERQWQLLKQEFSHRL